MGEATGEATGEAMEEAIGEGTVGLMIEPTG